MKIPKIVSIAIALIALLFVFSALPNLASSSCSKPDNFKYDGYEDLLDYFTWDTVNCSGDITFQVKGGGYHGNWVSVYYSTNYLTHNSGTTKLGITPLNNVPGYPLKFRVKVGNSPFSDVIEIDFHAT